MTWWRKAKGGRDRAEAPDIPGAHPDLDALAQELGATSWSRWPSVDSNLRSRLHTAPSNVGRWLDITPQLVNGYCRTAESPVHAAALLSMHPNGYVRESAVAVLSRLHSVEVVPALILRATDWVPVVATAAAQALREASIRHDAAELLPALGLLEPQRLSILARADVLNDFRQALVDRLVVDDLITALRLDDSKVRRAAARLLVERGLAGSGLTVGLAQDDPATASILVDGMSDAEWRQRGALESALTSKFGRVSVAALSWAQRNDPERAIAVSEAALLSPAPLTRFLAQHFLRQHDIDPARAYRANLDAGDPTALVGLGEVGSEADAEAVRRYLTSPRPRTRAAAVTALAKLVDRAAEDDLVDHLSDPSGCVPRAATTALIRLGPSRSTIEHAWKVARASPTTSARRSALRLLRSVGRWTALRMSGRAIASGDPDLEAQGHQMLEACLAAWNASVTGPTVDEKAELEVLVPSIEHRLDESTRELLRFSLAPYVQLDRR